MKVVFLDGDLFSQVQGVTVGIKSGYWVSGSRARVYVT